VAVPGLVGVADEELLAGARAGDQDCFARLIEPHIAAGYRLAVSMLNDPGQAEDMVQEATLRAWRSISRLSSSEQIKPWFLSIVANRCRTIRQTRWWSVVLMPLSALSSTVASESVAAREDLRRALRNLSAEDRAVVFLRFYEDMTSPEIGEVLGISDTAARSRIHRALRRLRVDLQEEQI
jgi:RNA polymerase sigma-70 factor (ECF subfamily)